MNDSIAPSSYPWTVNMRCDGVQVVRDQALTGHFIVVSPQREAAISVCPCCFGPIRSTAAARVIADREFPLQHVLERS